MNVSVPETPETVNKNAVAMTPTPCTQEYVQKWAITWSKEGLPNETIRQRLRNATCADTLINNFVSAPAQTVVAPSGISSSRLVIERASQIKPERLEWLWKDTLLFGKLNLFVGNPGEGKSLASIDIAARASTGTPFPNSDERYAPIEAILFSLEDDANDTIVPRLMGAGADMTKVHVVKHVEVSSKGAGKQEKQFGLDTDLPLLEATLKAHPGVRLIVIDPVTNHFSHTNPNKDEQLRPVLSALGTLAAKHKIAIILITHFNKQVGVDSIHRIAGGVAMVAVARIAWAFITNEEDAKHLMLNAKTNVTARNNGKKFTIAPVTIQTEIGSIDTIQIKWDKGTISANLTEKIDDAENPAKRQTREVQKWLEGFLSNGAKSTMEVSKAGEAEGYTYWQINAASLKIPGLEKKKDTGPRGQWIWTLGKYQEPEDTFQ